MPMVYQQNINPYSKLGVWHIAETEAFFTATVPLQREITHPHKRLQHLAGRFLLKELFPDFPYELIKIADTHKPFLEDEAFHFSISHCGDYAAVMVSTASRVGVDVELISAKPQKVKHKFLSEDEHQLILQLGAGVNDGYNTFLTLAWSIKESMYKWYGDGEIDFIEHLQINAVHIDDNSGVAHCKLLKAGTRELAVHFLLFNQNCISWISSDV